MKIQINNIKPRSLVDGEGERTVVFLQGCPIRCPGCQNSALWDASGGASVEISDVVKNVLLEGARRITISGGEPFAQPKQLAVLVMWLREAGFRDITVYSGYTWEELVNPVQPHWLFIQDVLKNIDTLVDGRYDPSQDDNFVNWRGSRNQRPIAVQDSLDCWLHEGKVVVLDWDSPRVVISADGSVVAPQGLAEAIAPAKTVGDSRMCGQTTPLSSM